MTPNPATLAKTAPALTKTNLNHNKAQNSAAFTVAYAIYPVQSTIEDNPEHENTQYISVAITSYKNKPSVGVGATEEDAVLRSVGKLLAKNPYQPFVVEQTSPNKYKKLFKSYFPNYAGTYTKVPRKHRLHRDKIKFHATAYMRANNLGFRRGSTVNPATLDYIYAQAKATTPSKNTVTKEVYTDASMTIVAQNTHAKGRFHFGVSALSTQGDVHLNSYSTGWDIGINTAEMKAIYMAIAQVGPTCGKLVVYSDSLACVTRLHSTFSSSHCTPSSRRPPSKRMRKAQWLENMQQEPKNGRATVFSEVSKATVDLMRGMAKQGVTVEVRWVKGHADNAFNNLADKAARTAITGTEDDLRSGFEEQIMLLNT